MSSPTASGLRRGPTPPPPLVRIPTPMTMGRNIPGPPPGPPPSRPRVPSSAPPGSHRTLNPVSMSPRRINVQESQNQPPSPQIGGGTDSDTWWVGGPNVDRLHTPNSANCRRPSELKFSYKVEEKCIAGLPENRQLGTEDDKDNLITFNSWIKEVRDMLEMHGLDTVFYVKEPYRSKEHYILTNWGEVDMEKVKTWVKELKTGVTTENGRSLPVCRSDLVI